MRYRNSLMAKAPVAHRRQRRLHTRAFTLIEMMVTVAIIGILVGMAFSYGQGGTRSSQLRQIAMSIVSACNEARGTSLRTGSTSQVSLGNQQVQATASLLIGGAYQTTVLSRYPQAPGSQYDSSYAVTSRDLQEFGQTTPIAAFDGRGCFVDRRDSMPRHEANICVTDLQTGATMNIALNRLGVARITGSACAAQPGCPGAQTLQWIP